jgi:hypothetical protein
MIAIADAGPLLALAKIDLVNAIKARPDVWVSNALCDRVIRTLQTD